MGRDRNHRILQAVFALVLALPLTRSDPAWANPRRPRPSEQRSRAACNLPRITARVLELRYTFLRSNAGRETQDVSSFESLLRDIETGKAPPILNAYGTSAPILRAFEVEGRTYGQIAHLYIGVRSEATERLRSLATEKPDRELVTWLSRYPTQYRPQSSRAPPRNWSTLRPIQQLEFIVTQPNFFNIMINLEGRTALFRNHLLPYEYLIPSQRVPLEIEISNDRSLHEHRLRRAEANRDHYRALRSQTATVLGVEPQHQHFFHFWPESSETRGRIAPRYVEFIAELSWFTFWRTMGSTPDRAAALIRNPETSVYSSSELAQIEQAFRAGNYRAIHDPSGTLTSNNFKKRTIGMRAFPTRPDLPSQNSGQLIASWEIRVGNTGPDRGFIENLVEAQLASGDYQRIPPYNNQGRVFDVNENPDLIPEGIRHQLAWIRRNYLIRSIDLRKILAPFNAWETRIPLSPESLRALASAREAYARVLQNEFSEIQRRSQAGQNQLSPTPNGIYPRSIIHALSEAIAPAMVQFAQTVHLDADFRRALLGQNPPHPLPRSS